MRVFWIMVGVAMALAGGYLMAWRRTQALQSAAPSLPAPVNPAPGWDAASPTAPSRHPGAEARTGEREPWPERGRDGDDEGQPQAESPAARRAHDAPPQSRLTPRGSGTPDDPLEISWDLLVSAQQAYSPREGRRIIPQRIAALDGQHVRITGYIAFPLLAESPDECLVMLNQWDGCCIGVPPTPYDAVEVRLREPATGDARLATYGTVRGVMRVEPYLVGDFLVGLYVLEEATLSTRAYGGFVP